MATMEDDAAEIERDRAVIAAATPGPWFAHVVDDSYCMNARTITREGGTGELDDSANNVAIVLLQEPRYASVADNRWDENAAFIVRARTRWPAVIDQIELLTRRLEAAEKEVGELRAALGKRGS